MEAHEFLLISGIPGSGKTSFCRWLDVVQGYRHVEVDTEEDKALHSALVLGDRLRLAQVVSKMRNEDIPTVIDWNLPPSRLKSAQRLRDMGASIWWFDGDRATAAGIVVQRGNLSLPAFERQMLEIDESWLDIRAVFARRILRVLEPGPAFETPQAIFERMQQRQ